MSVAVPHYVYRCYDVDGHLLYIGCTSHVGNRMYQHRKDLKAKASRWLQASMDRFVVGARYPDHESGLAAEAAAIRAEQPLFNTCKRGIPGRLVFVGVAEYLIPRGHVDLVLATTCLCWGDEDFVSTCYSHELAADAISTRRAQADEVAA